jgi:hypothetical protein
MEADEPNIPEKTDHNEEVAENSREKELAIRRACKHRDLNLLRDLADSPGGLLSDNIREEACESDYILHS